MSGQEMMRAHFHSFGILTPGDVEALVPLCTPRKLEKHAFFIQENEVCESVAFVVSGLLRSFYVASAGEETTYCLMFPNNLITAYSSFINGQPTAENIQAITAAELLIIPKKAIDVLVATRANWLRLLKVFAEQQYLELEKRIFLLQGEKAGQRYADLLHTHPEYVQNIPLQYLASYLGITQRHLSRIRGKRAF